MSWDYILGPKVTQYKKLPESDNFIFIDDHIGFSLDDTNVDHLLELLHSSTNCDTRIVMDYIHSRELELKHYNKIMFIPVWAILSVQEINEYVPYTSCIAKTSAFNFSINKSRLNRLELLQLLEKHQLTTDTYSLCGTRTHHGFKPRYHITDQETLVDDAILNGAVKNSVIYQNYLRKNVYEPSYISLITEPSWHLSSTFITEKTVFAFEAQTIPLWVGGYRQAHYLKQIGFDVFDDIVNHDYQELMRPNKRIQMAIEFNLDLLRDINFLKDFYNKNINRFENNRKLIRKNQLKEFVNRELNRLKHWPEQTKIDIQKLCGLYNP